jgi:hypothetical protein
MMVHLCTFRDNTTTFHMIVLEYTKAFTNATRRYYRSVNDDGENRSCFVTNREFFVFL